MMPFWPGLRPSASGLALGALSLEGLGFRVWGVWGSGFGGFGLQGSGGLGFRVRGVWASGFGGFGLQGLGGLGFRVWGVWASGFGGLEFRALGVSALAAEGGLGQERPLCKHHPSPTASPSSS